MVAHALLGIVVMECLVYLMESHVIRCPEQAEWNIRAEIQCQNTTKYFCLYNDIDYTYKEGCTGPDLDRPGSKRIYSRNFNRAPCNDTRYQPIKFVTNGNSDCIFRKSLCTEEGQILFTNGTTKTDSTCRCDYKQGYAFVTVPRNKCSCRPSEEDCSCYLKKCQEIGYYLSADYECTKNGTKKTVCSLMSENPSEDPHIDMAPTGIPREYDSYAIKRTCDVAILVSICFFVVIVIAMYIMLQQRLPRCPYLSTEQDVPVVNVESTSYPTKVGNRVTLQCTVTANPPHTLVGWQRVLSNGNTQPIDMTNSRYSGVTLGSPSLIIDNTIKTDEGKYVCIAANLVGSGQSQQTYLTVVGSTPTVTVPDPTYSVNRGSAIILECSYSANPPATQVRWQKENVDLGDTAGNAKYGGSTTTSASLIIYNAAESDEGTYVCKVTNTVGTGISTTTTLDVVGTDGNRLEEIVSGNNKDNQKYALVEIKKNKRTEEEFKRFNEVLDNLQNGAVKSAVAGKSGLASSDGNWKFALNELKDSINREGIETTLPHFNDYLDKWKNEPVKLAVTGKSGVGKSSFINAIRNLKSGDPGFATSSSSGNTTTLPTIYEYPRNPMITLHDLPGFGTIELPTHEYEKRMELNQYDYILIFVGNIEETDIEIANKLKKVKKPFCFVRSKIDIDIQNAEKDGESENDIVEKIRLKLSGNLKNAGFNKAKCFVISNHNQRIYQFQDLVSYIQNNLPGLKYDAVIFSILGELSVDVIDTKYKILKDRLWKISLATVALSSMHVSNTDIVFIMALICEELLLYHKVFGFEQQFIKDILKNADIRQKLNVSSIIEIQPSNEAMRTFAKIELEKLGTSEARDSSNEVIVPFIKLTMSEWPAGGDAFRLLIQVLDGCRDDSKLVYSHLMSVDA